MNKQKLLFIGAGRMAESIISGLVKKNPETFEEILVSNNTNGARLLELQEQYKVTPVRNWEESAGCADVILLAMPPGDHPATLDKLYNQLNGQLVITIAAGIGPSILENSLPGGTPAAWIMPNTAAEIGESISLFTCGSHVTESHRETLQVLLDSIGESEECTEQQIHDLTAITGSAPAFLYYFTETLISSAMEYGMDEETSRKLVNQMIYGSAAMLKTGTPPSILREQVTTPGGATAEGLKVLYEKGFSEMLKEAVLATNRKASGKQ